MRVAIYYWGVDAHKRADQNQRYVHVAESLDTAVAFMEHILDVRQGYPVAMTDAEGREYTVEVFAELLQVDFTWVRPSLRGEYAAEYPNEIMAAHLHDGLEWLPDDPAQTTTATAEGEGE